MNKYVVTISSDAMEDLRDIYSYIAFTLQAKEAASGQLNRIRKVIYSLETFPARHKLVEWEPWASMNVRQVPVDNYEIFYVIDEENLEVSIVRVFYGGRDIEYIIQNDDERID